MRFADDAEAVVLDPCHRGGPVKEAAHALGCAVEWHPGFSLRSDGLDEDYRGPEAVTLARSLGPLLDPALLGAAARSRTHDPQTLKRVWHHLARFGQVEPAGVNERSFTAR